MRGSSVWCACQDPEAELARCNTGSETVRCNTGSETVSEETAALIHHPTDFVEQCRKGLK